MLKEKLKTIHCLAVCLCMAFLCLTSGCDGRGMSGNQEESSVVSGAEDSGEGNYFVEDYDMENFRWRDNSTDQYSATVHEALRVQKSEEGSLGTTQIIFGKTRGSLFQKHYGAYDAESGLLDKDGTWDEMVIITADAVGSKSHRLAFPFTPDSFSQAGFAGAVLGSDHYVCMNLEVSEEEEILCHFFEADEELKVTMDFYVDGVDSSAMENPNSLYKDLNGDIHVITRKYGESLFHYFIMDSQGEVKASLVMGGEQEKEDGGLFFDLRPLYDGRIAILRSHTNKLGSVIASELLLKDPFTEEESVLVTWEGANKDLPYYTLWDEKTILYANNVGIYLCDLTWENPRPLYEWKNHGISASAVRLQRRESGEIAACYNGFDGEWYYLVLEPTKEEVELQEISFAVASHQRDAYEYAVAAFNRKYPTYRIHLKTYNDTLLLTEIMAGKGPVLVDATLTDFEKQEKLWEPLDGVLKATGLLEELNPKVLELGKINGKTYGIVDSFYVYAMAVLDQNLEKEEWTYEGFLDYLEGKTGFQAIFPPVPLNHSGNTLVFSYFMHGLQDNYLLDVKAEKECLDVKRLERVLRLTEQYCRDEKYFDSSAEALKAGDVLCVPLSIRGVTAVTSIRKRYGENIQYIGFPAGNGGENLISGALPVAVRSSASKEEKRVAFTFLKEFLSYDIQKAVAVRDPNYGISVRKDLMEEQILRGKRAVLEGEGNLSEEQMETLQAQLEEDVILFRKLMEEARPIQPLPVELEEIMWGEFTDYFEGNITKEMLIDHLKNRVQLYLNEVR